MRQTLILGCIVASVSMSAWADDRYEDRASVIAVTPQFERVNNPRQECRTEYVRESHYQAPQRSLGGAIIGGIAGGLLGNTVGRGNGRVAAAAVGAGVGAIIGDRVDNNRQVYGRERVETRPIERCVTVDSWQTVNAGYLVDYVYNGRQYSTMMDHDPGRYVPVRVSVRPNGYVTDVRYTAWDDDDRGRGKAKGRHKQKHRYW